ncbi:prepilin-type cleavage/methylation protein [Clostridiales bacterium oral taxon 876 str. F0540]|nr:prepilin-type cleavage/methylation protein [Clostridiales bacterium oral taxon 876 str. F0540]
MKKGFTLLEVVVTISMLFIIASLSLINISNLQKQKNDTDVELCKSMILGTINDSKQYCRENNKPGYIIFDVSESKIGFYSGNKRIESLKLPGGVSIYSINTDGSRIDIDKFGFTSDAGTIKLRDKRGCLYTITINVGAGYVEIK